MTWEHLRLLIGAIEGAPVVEPSEPGPALQALEAMAEVDPEDRRLAFAVRALHDAMRAPIGVPPTVGGVRRERLIRWDGWSTTWIGVDLEQGCAAVLRSARPEEGAAERALDRDGRALAPHVPTLRRGAGWLAAPLPGTALADHPDATPGRLARLAATGFAALARYEEAGLWPRGVAEQWRETDEGLAITVLDAGPVQDPGPDLAWLAQMLSPEHDPETPLEAALALIAAFPPRRATEAIAPLRAALGTDLAAVRHQLFDRRRAAAQHSRHERLLDAALRLGNAMPPPVGRGAIGVDMDGRTTAIESRPSGVFWGPMRGMTRIWSHEEGFDAPEARRLLRARNAAPVSSRLNEEVDGDPRVADALGRWVAAGLKIRTIRLLLEKT